VALFFAWKRHKWNRLWLLVVAAFACLYLFSTPVFARLASAPLLNRIDGPVLEDPQQADVIVVLTGGMYHAGAIGWLPSQESFQRLAVGYELQRLINLRLPLIVSGGFTEGGNVPSEAAVAAEFFAAHRSELRPTELEQTSTNTYESAMQLAPMLRDRNARRVILVTSDIHMWRTLATFRARGIDAIPVPSLSLPATTGLRAWGPTPNGLRATTRVFYEYQALALYILSGKIGWSDLFYEANEQ
jgi:uncharacterized SAM-binding protein YcdF (DUF218 family)